MDSGKGAHGGRQHTSKTLLQSGQPAASRQPLLGTPSPGGYVTSPLSGSHISLQVLIPESFHSRVLGVCSCLGVHIP